MEKKTSIPERVSNFLAYNSKMMYKKATFKPYVTDVSFEGLTLKFFIGDLCGDEWYGNFKDVEFPELNFVRSRMLEKGDVVFDVGAHHGLHSLFYAKWAGGAGFVHTFEANPDNSEIIEKNAKLNKLKNMKVHNRAVGAKKGVISIKRISNAHVSDGKGHDDIDVPMVALDSFSRYRPSFLKIDVEGYEAEVLKGARRILRTKPKIVLELHTESLGQYGTSVDEIFELVNEKDYDLWIQWCQGEAPKPYRRTRKITTRVHLFALPKKGE